MYLYFRKEIDNCIDTELLELIIIRKPICYTLTSPLIRLAGRLAAAAAESVKSI